MSVFGKKYKYTYFPNENTHSRIRSPVVWLSFIGLLLLILNTFNVFEKIGITEGQAEQIFTAVISVLLGFGVLRDNGGGTK